MSSDTRSVAHLTVIDQHLLALLLEICHSQRSELFTTKW